MSNISKIYKQLKEDNQSPEQIDERLFGRKTTDETLVLNKAVLGEIFHILTKEVVKEKGRDFSALMFAERDDYSEVDDRLFAEMSDNTVDKVQDILQRHMVRASKEINNKLGKKK